jgi:uncharacterized protein DUF2490
VDHLLRVAAVAALGTLGLLTPSAASASDSQLWTGGSVTVKLSHKWNLSQDMTARFSDNKGGLYELEANTLVGYQLSKTVSLWAGYDHDPQYSGGHFTIMEHRLVEHVVSSNLGKLGSGQLSGRVRLEQRWRDGQKDTGWRLRPYLRYTVPFSSRSKVGLALSVEPFFDLNTTSFQSVHGLERLRSLVAITAPLSKHLSADVGYMNQHGFVPHAKDTSDNIAYFSIGLKL